MALGEIYSTRGPVLAELTALLGDGPTWIEVVRGDQTEKFVGLMNDLRRKYSVTGDGKRITCCYAYMGVEPALAWATACRDLMYPVMTQGIESFGERWRSVRGSVGPTPRYYVSLGPGDGQKDGVLLADLPGPLYLPVDASTEMLRLAVRDLIVGRTLSRENVLALPWDFTAREHLRELRGLLDPATPALFSLLGNTLANFDGDANLLGLLADELLRPGDRLLLEVATTAELSDELACAAAEEYGSSPTFGEFVTAALRRYTDLPVDQGGVEYLGTVEDDRALLVKMVYRNRTGADIPFTLPNRAEVRFAEHDTIRLALSRKYSAAGLAAMLAGNDLTVRADARSEFTGTRFGLSLMVLERSGAPPAVPLADRLWSR